ncbi:hypothetical protein [Salisaeta longa]|uniref:hypothetical protein n=1 Tax=Salisaeta longa TaxID=503170 RepID=UPI0003B7115C|nr:hypothetical protein [Salisaeta longa]
MQQLLQRSLFLFLAAGLAVGCSSTGATQTATRADASAPAAAQDTAATAAPARPAALAQAVQYANAFQQQLSTYEAQRQAALEALTNATSTALARLDSVSQPADLRAVTETWRQQWTAAARATEQLGDQFTDVETSGTRYFNQLNRQTARIANPELRASELENNLALQRAWTQQLQQSAADLRDVRLLVNAGNDVFVTLLNASLRPGTTQVKAQVQELQEDAQALLEELYAVTSAGYELVGTPPSASAPTAAK